MSIFEMNYGREKVAFSLPDEDVLGTIDSSSKVSTATEEEVVQDALANPIGSPRLGDLVKPGESVCIIVSDITRAWQRMWVYLPYIVDELNAAGIRDEDILFLSSTGTHRTQTPEEHQRILGPRLAERFTMIDHRSTDRENLELVGTTSYGTPVELNRLALQCDHIVLTGAIVYHFMAGWGGGRKSILPGISGFETIMANHAQALNPTPGGGQNPNSRSGNFENNLMHLDMLEAAAMVKPTFMFNVIMGSDGKISSAVAGDYVRAHEEGARIVDENDGVDIDELADLAIATAGGYPKDINLYQTSKTIFNAMEATRKGGTIIVLSECSEGFGNDQVKSMLLDFDNTIEREKEIRRAFTIAKFVGYVMGYVAENWDFVLVCDIEPDVLKGAGIHVFRTIDEALAHTYGKRGSCLKTWIMPHGANTLPRLKAEL